MIDEQKLIKMTRFIFDLDAKIEEQKTDLDAKNQVI